MKNRQNQRKIGDKNKKTETRGLIGLGFFYRVETRHPKISIDQPALNPIEAQSGCSPL